MARYRKMIRDDVTAKIVLDDLGAAAGVTRFQVIRDFKRLAHVTPGQYVRLARVQHAKTLLASGKSLSEAATASGFFDQSHFSNHFRRIYGITPASFVATLKGSADARLR